MSGLVKPVKANRVSGYKAYKSTQSTSWTRIEMLLALYSKTIEHVQAALDNLEQGNAAQSLLHRTRAAALVVAIRSGIDPQADAQFKIDPLCEYMQLALGIGDVKHLMSTLKILKDLHEAFANVREQAVALERDGKIPPLPLAPQLDATI